MQSVILNSGKYENIDDVHKAANHFCKIHNEYHHYSTQEGTTPNQRMNYFNYPLKRLDPDYLLPNKNLPLSEGGDSYNKIYKK